MDLFSIEDLTFSYPTAGDRLSLDHVNLNIQAGEYLAICGKSGSGKTTLLRHLKTVLTPHGKHSGQVIFSGTPLNETDLRTQSARIGFVMQNPDSQIVTDKVWHELAFGLESLGTDQQTMRLRVAEMASYFGIQSWFHRDTSSLSGGQKQLLNLASIMAMQPDVLILDEPTSQLDPIAASDFLNTVRKINRELGTTIILTEHRLEDVLHGADRMVVMENGRVLTVAPPRKAGQILWEKKSEMFSAMPSPMQVFFGMGKTTENCPLTVREGRGFLSDSFAHASLTQTALDPGPVYEEPSHPILSAHELWYRYEKNSPDVLKGASFSVEAGSIFAIVGSNGAGKSTLLRSLCGIGKPYRGKILLHGKKLDKYSTKELFRENLAMLPQDPQSLFVKKTVREDLEEMMENGPKRAEKITAIAEICQIDSLLENHPYDLSGGEQQRAALAKVLLTDPKVLLLDEPTKGLDSFFKKKFAQILLRLKSQGVTILMVSHDVEFCAAYADTVSMFFDGQILTTNTPKRFFSGNSFYTTAANRMSRHIFENAVTSEDLITLCQKNLAKGSPL